MGFPDTRARERRDNAIMSAMRSVVGTVAENLVIGRRMSTWGKSCNEPILCWLKAPCPPIMSIGLSARKALAMPVIASVVPGPEVTTAQPAVTRDGIGADLFQRVAQVRVAVGVVDGGGQVELGHSARLPGTKKA